jgi:hypothetical protein
LEITDSVAAVRQDLFADGLDAFEADLILPQIAEIILVKKPLIDAETKLRKKHFPGVGRERGTAHSAHAAFLATNHETLEVIVAPIECDLEQVVQRGDAAVAAHMETPPNRRVDLEEQDVELVNFGRSVWLDHSGPRSLCGRLSPRFFPVSNYFGTWNFLPLVVFLVRKVE